MPPSDPCERYAAYVKTAGGLTPSDTTGVVASSFDYREWLTLEQTFAGIYETNVKRLADADPQAAIPWVELMDEELKARANDLPPWWTFVPATGKDTIAKAKDLVVDWSCSLAELEDAMVAAGVTPLIPFKSQKPPETPLEKAVETAGDLGKGLLLLAALWFLGRSR